MSNAASSAEEATARRLAVLTTFDGLAAMMLFLLAAALRGLKLSIEPVPVLMTLAVIGALLLAYRRQKGAQGDVRLANSAGIVMVLFSGGLAGGLICLVGQTFALPFIDPLLHRSDQMIGVDLTAIIGWITRVEWVPRLLAVAYDSSFPLLFLTALAFVWTGRARQAWELCGIFNVCLLAATISSALIPAVGAFHFLPIGEGVRAFLPPGSGIYHLEHLFALRAAESFVIDPTQLAGVATFPSFHTALALMTAAAWRNVPRIRVAMFAWQGLVIISTIPIGGHYVIDLIAGAACWGLAHVLWRKAQRVNTATKSSGDVVPAFA